MFYFRCTHCNKRIDYEEDLTGEKVQCCFCDQKFFVEKAYSEAPEAAAGPKIYTFRCPYCDQSFDMGDDLTGKKLQCGTCEKKFIADNVSQRSMQASTKRPEPLVAPPVAPSQPAPVTRPAPSIPKKKLVSHLKWILPVAISVIVLASGVTLFVRKIAYDARRERWIQEQLKSEYGSNGGIEPLSISGKDTSYMGADILKPDRKRNGGSPRSASKRDVVGKESSVSAASVPRKSIPDLEPDDGLPVYGGLDINIVPAQLALTGGARIEDSSGDILVNKSGAGFALKGRLENPGRYQVWVTYFCNDKKGSSRFELNGKSKKKDLMYMGKDVIKRFYDKNDKPINGNLIKSGKVKLDKYYFREYMGSYDVNGVVDLKMTYSGVSQVSVDKIELTQERKFRKDMEPLLFSAIDFFSNMQVPGKLVRCAYDIKWGKERESNHAATSVCGIALIAYAMNHQLGRDPDAAQKVLTLLRACNGKNAGVNPARHKSGFFMHFVDSRTGKGGSEYSTIDTSIMISGVLIARNVFNDPRIKAEADELWNSINWASAVVSTHPSTPKFYLTGKQIDGKAKGTISMFNEYILLAWYCQKYEDQKKGSRARENIMPKLDQLPRTVYRNRIMLSSIYGAIQPSFLVQFPFYLSDLCSDELFFSYTAAQAMADRETCTERYGYRTAWGVAPGCTPKKGYSVNGFGNNPENVVTPRIVAAFTPVLPVAADDLYLRYKNPANRQKLKFGTILPRFVPGKDWQPNRLAGVDFACLLYGMGAMHPKIGIEFFKKNTQFTFNK